MTNRYEADTRFLFVNTKNHNGQSDQVNDIKLNLGTRPIHNDDDSVVKLTLKQFNLPCNWWNVNSTNNTFRVVWKAFTHNASSTSINAVDTLLKIPVGTYLNHTQLQNAFCTELKSILDAAVQGGSVTFSVARIADKTTEHQKSSQGNTGIVYPQDATDLNNRILGIKVTCSDNTFQFNNEPHISSLFCNPSDGFKQLDGGKVLDADEQYNDSATLFGGNRTSNFLAISDSNGDHRRENCFSIMENDTDDHTLDILGFYPMNTALNTLPYVYLRFNGTHNQSTANIDEGNNNHKDELISSHVFAKIPRVEKPDGSVFFNLDKDDVEYSTILTSQTIQNLEFSLCDHLGRQLPQNNVDFQSYLGSTLYRNNVGSFNKTGNLFCDFTLKVERIHIPFQPNTLQGFSQPLRENPAFINNLINTGC